MSLLQSKMKKSSRRGSVQLKGATVGVDEEDARSFTVENRSKKYRLQGKEKATEARGLHTILDACAGLSLGPMHPVMRREV